MDARKCYTNVPLPNFRTLYGTIFIKLYITSIWQRMPDSFYHITKTIVIKREIRYNLETALQAFRVCFK